MQHETLTYGMERLILGCVFPSQLTQPAGPSQMHPEGCFYGDVEAQQVDSQN